MKRKRITPQEKKLLSYVKDTRNSYGESGARSRFAIAKRKSIHHQALRHEKKLILKETIKVSAEEFEIIESKMKSVEPKRWRKFADSPLGEIISNSLIGRELNGMNENLKRRIILQKAKKRWKPKSRYSRWGW